MLFKTTIVGKVIDSKISKKGKRYLKIYDGNELYNVFTEEGNNFDIGEEVVISCIVICDRAYIKQEGEG